MDLGGIGRGYEHDFREIERNFQEMIGKFFILFRIEHLQQCGRRISLKSGTHLIHFIEQEHRVIGSRVLDSVYNSARYSSYICSVVTPYLGLVANSAKSHSYEFPSRSSGYGLGYRGLAYLGGPTRQIIGPLSLLKDVTVRYSSILSLTLPRL